MRLLSSGSVTSVQLSDLRVLDLDDDEECFLELELWLFDDDEVILNSSSSDSTVTFGRLEGLDDAGGEALGLTEELCPEELDCLP